MEANATTLKIKVFVEQKKTADGRTFPVYKAITSKNGVKVDLKFRKEVTNRPEKSCYMFVDIDKINEQKNTEYPLIWVSEVMGYEDFNAGGDLEANRARMREMFGN